VRFAPSDFVFFKEFRIMLEGGIMINFGLGVFNLLPLPPLDGSKIVESMLSYPAMQKYEQIGQYSFIILILLISTHALSFLGVPILMLSELTLRAASFLVGIF
jgi:Zn-dependent protease